MSTKEKRIFSYFVKIFCIIVKSFILQKYMLCQSYYYPFLLGLEHRNPKNLKGLVPAEFHKLTLLMSFLW